MFWKGKKKKTLHCFFSFFSKLQTSHGAAVGMCGGMLVGVCGVELSLLAVLGYYRQKGDTWGEWGEFGSRGKGLSRGIWTPHPQSPGNKLALWMGLFASCVRGLVDSATQFLRVSVFQPSLSALNHYHTLRLNGVPLMLSYKDMWNSSRRNQL